MLVSRPNGLSFPVTDDVRVTKSKVLAFGLLLPVSLVASLGLVQRVVFFQQRFIFERVYVTSPAANRTKILGES